VALVPHRQRRSSPPHVRRYRRPCGVAPPRDGAVPHPQQRHQRCPFLLDRFCMLHARHPRTSHRHAVVTPAAANYCRGHPQRDFKIDKWLRWSTSTPTVWSGRRRRWPSISRGPRRLRRTRCPRGRAVAGRRRGGPRGGGAAGQDRRRVNAIDRQEPDDARGDGTCCRHVGWPRRDERERLLEITARQDIEQAGRDRKVGGDPSGNLPPQDPQQFHDWWQSLSPAQKDRVYSNDHDIGNRPGMPWDPPDHLGKDHYNRLHLPELEQRTQTDIDRMQHSLDDLRARRRKTNLPGTK